MQSLVRSPGGDIAYIAKTVFKDVTHCTQGTRVMTAVLKRERQSRPNERRLQRENQKGGEQDVSLVR